MYTRKNAKNKTNFVGHNTTGVELYLSTPVSGAHGASRLTLRAGETRLDLNGRQIRALRQVLDSAYSQVTPRTTKASKTTKATKATRRTSVTK
jgi:hypothetical protein